MKSFNQAYMEIINEQRGVLKQFTKGRLNSIITGKDIGSYCLISAFRSTLQDIPAGRQVLDSDKQGWSPTMNQNKDRNSRLRDDLKKLQDDVFEKGCFTFVKMRGGYIENHERDVNERIDAAYDKFQGNEQMRQQVITDLKINAGYDNGNIQNSVNRILNDESLDDARKKQMLHRKMDHNTQKSFLVFFNGNDTDRFREQMIRLGVKYNQDCILFKDWDSQDARWVRTNACDDKEIGDDAAILDTEMHPKGQYFTNWRGKNTGVTWSQDVKDFL